MTEATETNSQNRADALRAARQKAMDDIFGEQFVHRFQSPVLFIDNAVLESPTSVRFFRKDFAYLSKQLHMEYQYRSWKGFNQEMLERYNEIVTKKLDNISIMMTNTINRLQKLLDQNSIKMEGSVYPNPLVVTVPVIATHARTYFKLLSDMDRVILMAGTANLLGVIDSKQRTEAEMLCKKMIRAFRSVLQTEVTKLYREADRLVKEQHSRGEVDTAMKAAVEEQGKDIAAFNAAKDGDSEPGLDLGGSDPGQMIDDVAAATTAMAAASKAKGRAKAKADEPTSGLVPAAQ